MGDFVYAPYISCSRRAAQLVVVVTPFTTDYSYESLDFTGIKHGPSSLGTKTKRAINRPWRKGALCLPLPSVP